MAIPIEIDRLFTPQEDPRIVLAGQGSKRPATAQPAKAGSGGEKPQSAWEMLREAEIFVMTDRARAQELLTLVENRITNGETDARDDVSLRLKLSALKARIS